MSTFAQSFILVSGAGGTLFWISQSSLDLVQRSRLLGPLQAKFSENVKSMSATDSSGSTLQADVTDIEAFCHLKGTAEI